MDKKRILTMLALAFFLAGLPLGSYIYLRSGLDFYKENMAMLEEKGEMPDFSATTASGEPISRDSLKGLVYLVNFFDINCTGPCEKTKEQLLLINSQFKKKAEVVLLSFTTKPAEDNLLSLTAFAQKNGINQKKWLLLNSDQQASIATAAETIGEKEIPLAQRLLLVDAKGQVRGAYDAHDEKAFNDMVTHITLIMPPAPKKEYKYRPEKEL